MPLWGAEVTSGTPEGYREPGFALLTEGYVVDGERGSGG